MTSKKKGKKRAVTSSCWGQEAIPIIDPSYSGPSWPLGGRGETTKLTKKSMLIISTRPWAKGPANLTLMLIEV